MDVTYDMKYLDKAQKNS